MSEKYIVAFSGPKQSGKSNNSKFIHSLALNSLGFESYVSDSGDLMVNSTDGFNGLDLDKKDKEFVRWMEDNVYPFIKQYAFADVMKEAAINIFGLSYSSVYGTDAEKMEPTHILWQNFPLQAWDTTEGNIYVGQRKNKDDVKKTGPMSGRQFLQFVGTELFRKMCPGVFVSALKRKIEEDKAVISVCVDVRFDDEIEMLKSIGGKVIRLTRNPTKDSSVSHESEHALDRDKFDWSKFDVVIDNGNLSQAETHAEVYKLLVEWGVVREEK